VWHVLAILWHVVVMRTLRLVFAIGAIGAALACGACLQSTVLIKVNGDGSGTIEQGLLMTGTALAQLRSFAALGNGAKPVDPFSEAQMRANAASIGPTVTYLSSTPIKTEEGEGRNIIYAFTDINQLRINQQPPTPGGLTTRTPDDAARRQAVLFALERQPNGNALLRITMPTPQATMMPMMPATPVPDADGKAKSKLTPEQLAMAKQMFAGMRIAIAVEPEGRLVSATSPFIDGQRVTLVDVDFDQILKEDGALARLQSVRSVEEANTVLKDIPGLKICLEREITIEFTPAKAF
jgi:hypothetical protein